MVGASAHRVALDNVEVLEVDQWLALLIIGDLAPYTQPVTGPELLPTRSAKSPISLRSTPMSHDKNDDLRDERIEQEKQRQEMRDGVLDGSDAATDDLGSQDERRDEGLGRA